MQQAAIKIGAESVDGEAQQYLTFMLGGKVYGLEILNIKEIIEYGEITEVPMTPDFISGVINLRGSVVPVIDLTHRFAGTVSAITKRTSIIILEVRGDDLTLEVGVTVDMVNEVLDIQPDEIEPAPSLGTQIHTDFISGMAKVDDKLLILLNIEKVLSIDELALLGGVHDDAQQPASVEPEQPEPEEQPVTAEQTEPEEQLAEPEEQLATAEQPESVD